MRIPITNLDSRVPLSPVDFADLSDFQPLDHLDLGLVGDVLLTDRVLSGLLPNWPSSLRSLLWQPLDACPLVIANLEAPITKREAPVENKPYNLKTSGRALAAFDSRFVLNLANNHTMDYGPDGLLDTIEAIEAAGLMYTGAGSDLDHARAPRHLSVAGIDIAVIGAADARFQPATASTPGTCPATAELLVDAILTARRRAQLVVVSIHMGLEHVHLPSAGQMDLAKECLTAGAQLVHFHHSHCLSGSVSDGRGIVLFGTGNYVFPRMTMFDGPGSKRTALWKARYSTRTQAIVALDVEPLAIDDIGLPRALTARAAEREREEIRRYSRRTLSPTGRRLWRVLDMLHPRFVLLNIYNYASLLKRRGPAFVWRSLVAGIRAQGM